MNTAEIKKLWEAVKKELEETIPASSFEPWIMPLEPVSFEGNQFTLITGQSFGRDYIKKQHYNELRDGFKKVTGEDIIVNIEFDEELSKRIKKERQNIEKKLAKEVLSNEQQKKSIENLSYVQSMNINLRYRFDNFVTDSNNKIAKAACESVAQNPSVKYNPLYIYGESGLGKTHLMQAIGHYIVFNKSELKVRCVKTEDFINDYINSTSQNKDFSKTNLMNKFRQKYRNIDILLIDDIHFIEGKKKCMDEVFNTFDTLYNANKQIVLTSDRLPKDMPELPNRLRTRFEQGLMVEIRPPEFVTRVTILENLAKEKGVNFPQNVLEYIAKYFVNNIRELEGAFNKVEAYAEIESAEISLQFAKHVLQCKERANRPDIEKVCNVVAAYYNVSITDLQSTARVQIISNARAVASYICREKLQMGYENIANFLNKKHQTILYSYEKIKVGLQSDKKLQDDVKKLIKTLNL